MLQELSARCGVAGAECWLREDTQLAALRHIASRLAANATELMVRAGGGKVAFEGPAWNGNTVDLIR